MPVGLRFAVVTVPPTTISVKESAVRGQTAQLALIRRTRTPTSRIAVDVNVRFAQVADI